MCLVYMLYIVYIYVCAYNFCLLSKTYWLCF